MSSEKNVPDPVRDLEQDLYGTPVEYKVRDNMYAARLYCALCNVDWVAEEDEDDVWACSWRYAGGLVAKLRGKGEGYMEFYCSGHEGIVDPEIEEDLNNLGWKVRKSGAV